MNTAISNEISINDIKSKNFKLSPSLYQVTKIGNSKSYALRSLLDGFEKHDKGSEVGSHNYINESPKKFMRTKALRSDSFLPQLNTESTEAILPISFIGNKLTQDDILISKDSNIGEVVILDKDYPNYMMSGGLNRLNVNDNKYYIFGVLKTDFFKDQLKRLASRGSTITHAKTLFLDCMIPFPDQKNDQQVINYLSDLVKLVISKEKSLTAKKCLIEEIIESELENQSPGDSFSFDYPSVSEMLSKGRIDAGSYSEKFKTIEAKIKNYVNGCFYIDISNIKSGSTPKKRYISETIKELPYSWITPTHFTDMGGIAFTERLRSETNNLNEDSLLIVNRTSRGGRGEYVGLCAFFDYKRYGASHHNQGIYRVTGYPNVDLAFMGAFLNSNPMRQYCAGLTVGSKMKEIKSKQFSTVPFPNFDKEKKLKVASLYYNEATPYLTCDDIAAIGEERNKEAGIVQLNDDLTQLKNRIDSIVNKIATGEIIEL
ncbi:MAG: restriction endonuclease subunit S [bacterium]|nr:restriction endonuclease subunit S [bacterium]